MSEENTVTMSDLDLVELLQAQNKANDLRAKLDGISGNIFRLQKEQDLLFGDEKMAHIIYVQKKSDLERKYNLAPGTDWKVDIETKVIIPQK